MNLTAWVSFLSLFCVLIKGYELHGWRRLIKKVGTAVVTGSPFLGFPSTNKGQQVPVIGVEEKSVSSPISTFPKFGRKIDETRSSTQKQVDIQNVANQFVRNAVKSVGPSVVRIDCEREISQILSLYTDMKEGETIKVSGTGIIVSDDGFILTNAHVIDQAKKVTITLSNDRSFKASIVSYDEFTDLAVLKADVSRETDFRLLPAPLGDSSNLQSGDWVIAVGCPVGLDFTVTLGVVSNPRRAAAIVGVPHLKGSYIQTDAALNSGNSGGPLVNDAGEVIGINTMVRTNTEAIGFAIPINQAKQIYEVLKTGKKPTHAYFGIETISNTPDNAHINNEDPNSQHIPEIHGALVLKVMPNSPAEKCGLRRNDVITEVNGNKIRGLDDAEQYLDDCKPGKISTLTVIRGENSVEHKLQATPQDLHALLEERKRQQQQMVIIRPAK
jgi:S1-C subfamily serine protease|eukprot:gene1192-1263_t